MLTDEQLKVAARYMCDKSQLDPDDFDPLSMDGPGFKTYEEVLASQVRKHELLHEAIGHAKAIT